MEDIKVSVIVPVYKVESFVERCARSLFSQTLQGIEILFVDDASPDNSVDIINKVAMQYPGIQYSIIVHDNNMGLPTARNTGLMRAKGEYIFHCDSDDFVDPTMLESLYHSAVTNTADIVWCDWYLSMSKTERLMVEPFIDTSEIAVKTMLGGGMKFNVWNKLIKRSLYTDNNIEFPDGRPMGEDLTIIKLFASADRVRYCPGAFYHYVKTNTQAYSRNYTDAHMLQLKENVQDLCDWLNERFGDKYLQELSFLKLEAKFPFLLMDDRKRFYKKWKEWFPEANAYISRNKYISRRSRMIQECALHNQFWIITMYSYLLNNVVYRIIYK